MPLMANETTPILPRHNAVALAMNQQRWQRESRQLVKGRDEFAATEHIHRVVRA